MSFLKCIVKADAIVNDVWCNNVERAFHQASASEKALFLLDQAVICHYLTTMCGENGLPSLIAHYKGTLKTWFLPDVAKLFNDVPSERRDPIVNVAYPNICVLLGVTNLGAIDKDECIKLLDLDMDIPRATDNTFYVPYLSFVSGTNGLERYAEIDATIGNNRSFSINQTVSIPSFKIIGRHLTTRYDVLLPSYTFDCLETSRFATDGIDINSILAYWAGYNWRGVNFSSVIGVLAAQCLEKDTNAIPRGSKLFGYLDVYKRLMCTNNCEPFASLALSSDTTIQRRNIIKFVVHLRRRYGVLFDNPKLLSTYLHGTNDDTVTPLHKYLNATSPSDISVEMYNAFKSSCFGNFSELDLVINGRIDRKGQAGYLNATKTEKEDDPDAKQDNPEKSEKSEGDTPEGTAPDETGTNPDDDKTKSEKQEETQDSSSDNKSDSDASPAETTPDEEPNSDKESNNDTINQSNTHTQQKRFSVPKLDDKRGVKLSLSEGETTNTVLYRKELGAYIDSLLANPPSFLSVQAISVLKILRSSWLNMLSPTDLHDFINALVRLPKSITLKKRG